MVDFRALKAKQATKDTPNPLDIFRRLPKGNDLNDLYVSQAAVLTAWFDRRLEKDLILKLHTGGGKTLVGLLAAKSTLIELEAPVVYLCPNNQLVSQTVKLAEDYGIGAVPYVSGQQLPPDFLDARKTLVATYSALFNGRTKFGKLGTSTLALGAVICDDAHSAFSILRDHFTVTIDGTKQKELYLGLCGIHRQAFNDIDQLGSFDDTVSGRDSGILEIPYWSWLKNLDATRALLRDDKTTNESFEWQFLRDNLKFCHGLVTARSVTITPLLPLVDLIPSFSDAPRRIYMSATLPDDGSAVLAFDVKDSAVTSPIISPSLAGVSERMILIPALSKTRRNKDTDTEIAKRLLRALPGSAACILVPSGTAAAEWTDIATYPSTPAAVESTVNALKDGSDNGPIVLANRYEGTDLADDACRVLVLAGLPTATNVYEAFRAICLADSNARSAALAQKIEQGAGRGARGQRDYCVVLLVGEALTSWISQTRNLKFMTNATRAQIDIGQEVSSEVEDINELVRTAQMCLSRDKDWREYQAEKLAELTLSYPQSSNSDSDAIIERKAFRIWRDGFHEKAIAFLKQETDKAELDVTSKAWLFQMAARISWDWGDQSKANHFQEQAHFINRVLLRPRAVPPYVPVSMPDSQAEMIFSKLRRYSFRAGLIDEFNQRAYLLVPTSSANQFEMALADLAGFLGFSSDRPDKRSTSGNGPDVLWLLGDHEAWLIEAKSRKLARNSFNKEDHGQLSMADKWFTKVYPGPKTLRLVTVFPSGTATPSSQSQGVLSLSTTGLNTLVSAIREMLEVIVHLPVEGDALKQRIQNVLEQKKLDSKSIANAYLKSLTILEEHSK